jgi:putative peptidoglycan lipid II flippase
VLFSILFSAWFGRIGWLPLGGLALANTLATMLEAGSLWILMRRRLGGLEGQRVLRGTSQAVLGAAAMVLALLGWLGITQEKQAWLVGGGGVLVGGLVYGIIIFFLKVPEVQSLINIIRRRPKPA